MRPKLKLLDEPCDKAKEIFKQEFDLSNEWEYPDIIYTQLTPVDTIVPVVCPCTGIDHVKASEVIYLNDEWKRNEGRQVTSTAEHTWNLILLAAKMKRIQLSGKTLGVIGYGRIGRQVLEYANAFNMNNIIYDPYKNRFGNIYESDIITLHVPLDDETRGMIGKQEFELIKDGAILVNTSRAEIVDYDALMEYKNKVYYADDFSDSRVLHRTNTIQTNHIGGNCVEAREMTDIYIANKTIEYWRSKNP